MSKHSFARFNEAEKIAVMQMTINTKSLLERIARLNPDAGEIGAGMLRQIHAEAVAALKQEAAPRYLVTQAPHATQKRWANFIAGEIVTVENLTPDENGDVYAISCSWQETEGNIPFASLELLGEPL